MQQPEVRPQALKRGGAKGQVIRAVQLNLGRPHTRNDIWWEVERCPGGAFQCRATIPHLGLAVAGAPADDRKGAERLAAEAMLPLVAGLPAAGSTSARAEPAVPRALAAAGAQVPSASKPSPGKPTSAVPALDRAEADDAVEGDAADERVRYEHLWHEDPQAEMCLSEEVCALMTGEIVYAWRCCLGIGRVREVRGPGAAGLDLDALREELCVWGLGLRSTMLFDNSIPFQLTANIVQCRSAALRAVLQEAFEMLQAFHASLGERRHFASPFEVIHRWALATAPGLPVVMLGGHRPIVEFVERHKEDLACTTVSGCRKRADSTYGKALPFGRFAVVNTIYRTKQIQLTRLQTFMQQHAGQICASLNYDPNVEMFAGERSYFRCFKEKRELALLMHGALSSGTGLRRVAAEVGLRAAAGLLPPLAVWGRRRARPAARLVALLSLGAHAASAVARLRAADVAAFEAWLERFSPYAWVRALHRPLGGLVRAGDLLLLAGLAAALCGRGRAWATCELLRAAALALQALGAAASYPRLVRGFQLHYEREWRRHRTVTVQAHPPA